MKILEEKQPRVAILTLSLLFLSIGHIVIAPDQHVVHEFLFKATYFPIILAGLWFGWKIGLVVAFFTSTLYLGHIYLQLFGHCELSLTGTFLDLFIYHLIGFITGSLSQRQKATQHQAEVSLKKLKNKTEEIFTLEKELEHIQRLKLMGEMVASVAHEIRTPLMSIMGAVEALKSEDISIEDTPEFWQIVDDGLDRINLRVTEFLNLAASETKIEFIALDNFFQSAFKLLKKPMEEKSLKMNTDVKLKVTSFKSDPSLMQQLFSNILLNAIQASPDDSSLSIRVRSSLKGLFFSIRDHGPGIPLSRKDKIFHPFFTTKKEGTGLGLAICRRIIRNLEGKIFIKSPTEGKGVVVAVWLPAK